MKLFVQHLLKKVQGDAVMEYMKVYKSMMKFFGKCMMIKEGKEVPMTVLSLIVEMMGWIKDELMNVSCMLLITTISYYNYYGYYYGYYD